MSYIFSFHSPVEAFFGFGSIEKIKELMAPFRTIGIVSGRTSLDATGMRAFLEAELAGKQLHFFSEVEENPSINTIIRGGTFMRSARCEAVIAVGGGSPLDAAKSIAVLLQITTASMSFWQKKICPTNLCPCSPCPPHAAQAVR
ncbi:MAG: iron-containing alcohol dehydrogenase [Geovibrio sp.]|nr:iron-containing alcohol dehydrogenase [Geovibrio sp.]